MGGPCEKTPEVGDQTGGFKALLQNGERSGDSLESICGIVPVLRGQMDRIPSTTGLGDLVHLGLMADQRPADDADVMLGYGDIIHKLIFR